MHAEHHEDAQLHREDREPQAPENEPEMVAQIRRYRALKRALEQQEQRAKEYLEQVKAEIEEDLRPLQEEIERARTSMFAFVQEHNGGRKFKVPGLGTAFTQRRLKVKIEDEEAFTDSLGDAEREGVYDLKLNHSRARALVQSSYKEDGEIRPGCEVEEKDALTVKLAGASGQ